MLENLPIGIPGTGFISKGIGLTILAFITVYYFSDNVQKKVSI